MRPVNAWCNDVSLRDLDARIAVRSVTEETPEVTMIWGQNPGADGQRFMGRSRVNRKVTVKFAVHELYDLAARSRVVDAVNAWAQDGYLAASYRPGRRLPVVVSAWASITDPRNYNEEFTVTFDAPSPYWEDVSTQRVTMTGTSDSDTLVNIGTAQAPVTAVIKHTSGTLNTLTLTVGSSTFAFTGLSVAANDDLVIEYVNGYLKITANSVSKMVCRSADSSDSLIAKPGHNTVTLSANRSVTAILEVRSRWL